MLAKEKKTSFHSLLKTPNLTTLVEPFYKENVDPTIISANGCTLIKSIYKCEKSKESLDELMFSQYKKLSTRKGFKLEKIPPTIGAATQHSYRCYFQVQKWLGNNTLLATQWGWNKITANKKDVLLPHFTDDPVIPDILLKSISCSCEKGCGTKCGCRKHGLQCTDLCAKCQSAGNCTNFEERENLDGFIDVEDILAANEEPTLCLNAEKQIFEDIFHISSEDEDGNEVEENVSAEKINSKSESYNLNDESVPKKRRLV